MESEVFFNIDTLIEMSTKIGIETSINEINKFTLENSKKDKIGDKRLRNTHLLLKQYRNLKVHVREAIYELNTIYNNKEYKKDNDLVEMFEELEFTGDNILINSIKNGKERTRIILTHIDNILEYFRLICLKQEKLIKWNIIYDLYLSDIESDYMSMSEIVNKYNVDERTIYRYVLQAEEDLSTLFFGLDGIIFKL